jgi:hypothetical protein
MELPEKTELNRSSNEMDAELHGVFREQADQATERVANPIELTAQRLRDIEGLREESWKQLDEYGRRAMLNAVGREVADVYHHPAPPLHIEDMNDLSLRGTYGDGFRSASDGGLEGADYRISMNSESFSPGDGVLGDNPRPALETYLHEYRHSYPLCQSSLLRLSSTLSISQESRRIESR